MGRCVQLTAVIALLLAATGGRAAAAPARASDRLVVLTERPSATHAPTHAHAAALAAIARTGAQLAGPSVAQIGLLTVRPRRAESLTAAMRRLRALPGVAAVQPERRMTLRELPDDPALHLPDPSAGAPGAALPAGTPLGWPLLRSGFRAAWDVTDGRRALVGVIDTGVDSTHPDLAGKLAAVVDEQASDSSRGPAGVDEEGHGTHVASVACAATGNGIGTAGAGHDCRLVIEKTDLSDASIAAAIVDATDRGVDAINMSFGDDGARPSSAALVRAIRYAVHRDVVLVAAAADEPVSEQGDPANVLQPSGSGATLDAGVGLTVTAATYAGGRASFAGFGSQISLAAYGAAGNPGSVPPGVLGAFPAATTPIEQEPRPCGCRTSVAGDDRYGYLAGTSMAAPQVAAAAALVRALNPDLTGHEVVRLLKRTARRTHVAGWSADLGWGILDAGRALRVARTIDRRAPESRLSASSGAAAGTVTLRWTARDAAPEGLVPSGVRAVEVYAERLPRHGPAIRRVLGARVRALAFHGVPGVRYGFFTRAVDRAGNRERRPARADAVVRVP